MTQLSPALRRTLLALFWLAIVALTALGLDRPVGDGDESMHAEILREMLRSGDVLHTRWYGVALNERPPLVYWLPAPFSPLVHGRVPRLRRWRACSRSRSSITSRSSAGGGTASPRSR